MIRFIQNEVMNATEVNIKIMSLNDMNKSFNKVINIWVEMQTINDYISVPCQGKTQKK